MPLTVYFTFGETLVIEGNDKKIRPARDDMLVEKTPNINFTNIASLRDANNFCYAVCYQYAVPSGTEFLFDR
jgi:hypothetical protein